MKGCYSEKQKQKKSESLYGSEGMVDKRFSGGSGSERQVGVCSWINTHTPNPCASSVSDTFSVNEFYYERKFWET